MPDLRVSYSAVQDWRQCRQRYWHRHVEKLEPKIRMPAMELGSLMHDYLESYYKRVRKLRPLTSAGAAEAHRKAARVTLRRYAEQTQSFAQSAEMLGEDGAEVAKALVALPALGASLIKAYHRVHSIADLKHHKIIMVEQDFQLEVAPGIVLPGRIDMVTKSRDGFWLWEHKTTKSVPERGSRFRDLQTLLYAVVLEELHGIKIAGVIWNYIRTAPPHPPKVLKDGSLSQAKDQVTTLDLYLETIENTNLGQARYEPFLRHVEERERTAMFPRFTLPLVQHEDVLLRDYLVSAAEIADARSQTDYHPVRSISQACDWCPFVKLCHAAVTGGDPDSLRTKLFTSERKDNTDGQGQDEDDIEDALESL